MDDKTICGEIDADVIPAVGRRIKDSDKERSEEDQKAIDRYASALMGMNFSFHKKEEEIDFKNGLDELPIKKCPLCGCDKHTFNFSDDEDRKYRYGIFCKYCGCSLRSTKKKTLINIWNTRNNEE